MVSGRAPRTRHQQGSGASHDSGREIREIREIRDHANHIDGVKVSLLSAKHEVSLRAALPDGVRLYTGDDFNYPEPIEGDGERHSDALLGAFAAITPAAAAALSSDLWKAPPEAALATVKRHYVEFVQPHV